jgi:mono/diheme cytochrome c family protein
MTGCRPARRQSAARRGGALVAALVAVSAPPVLAQDDPTGPEAGRAAFLEACAGCHGAEARGDGPTAALLTVDVPDLTRFAMRNDGEYDIARVIRTVDGRTGLAAHGGPMPMFGGLLTGASAVIDGADGTPLATTEPILAIARWLETVQEDTE